MCQIKKIILGITFKPIKIRVDIILGHPKRKVNIFCGTTRVGYTRYADLGF